MSTESAKKKLQEAGKSHFFFTFSRLRCRPAWKGKGKAGPHGGQHWGGERDPPPTPSPSYAFSSVQFSRSVMSDSLRPHEPQHAQASLSITNSQSPPKLMSTELVMPSNHLILCLPLLLLPSIFPSIGVFSNESYALGSPRHQGSPQLGVSFAPVKPSTSPVRPLRQLCPADLCASA